ncbi:MAG TPA: hypothetical protein HPP87_10095 [Planctomycetes bacterium]|nr:hypothetical protein [Planctomycetota bacterium]
MGVRRTAGGRQGRRNDGRVGRTTDGKKPSNKIGKGKDAQPILNEKGEHR